MTQTTHNQAFTATGLQVEGSYWAIATTCSDRAHHKHDLPSAPEVEWLTNTVSMRTSKHQVEVTSEEHGLVRWFGLLNYDAVAERIHITAYEGATENEINFLMRSALEPQPWFRPKNWYAHPCVHARNRVAIYRFVDDNYVDEVAAAMAAQDMTVKVNELVGGSGL